MFVNILFAANKKRSESYFSLKSLKKEGFFRQNRKSGVGSGRSNLRNFITLSLFCVSPRKNNVFLLSVMKKNGKNQFSEREGYA